ncbi:hypothetical protein CIPAW_16G055300 [Carya illinoinensis]|uniref:Uncharacterized protein n=1 Tax=Carya illinoinensis TaxID=32201 RepID=A0A8T1N228_CARIL|nr:hypothetical protein CIPAW_16G055300 [Carya illinoinensis]
MKQWNCVYKGRDPTQKWSKYVDLEPSHGFGSENCFAENLTLVGRGKETVPHALGQEEESSSVAFNPCGIQFRITSGRERARWKSNLELHGESNLDHGCHINCPSLHAEFN